MSGKGEKEMLSADDYTRGQKRYEDLFRDVKNLYEISDRLKEMEKDPDIEELRSLYCNEILYIITGGFIEYGDRKNFHKDPLVKLFIDEVKLLTREDFLFFMMAAYFTNNEKEVYKEFDLYIDWLRKSDRQEKNDEYDFVDMLLEPLKNAYPGFWTYAQKKTAGMWKDDGTDQLCQLMADIYERKSDDEAADRITGYIQKYPEIITAREYLGLIYCNLKMWNNAIAMLEGIETPVVFATNMAEYYFTLGWCYGKIKDYRQEEKHYRKALEENSNYAFALNNLGYSLYKQKKYLEAKAVFEQCLEQERDLTISAANYVKTLIALGRNKDAKAFIKSGKYKIDRSLKDRVKKLPDTNKRLKSSTPVDTLEDAEDESIALTPILSEKASQFSNEKILEDELTSRIESGVPVFGKHLKVYKRKGEYGRQYIIPIGRLDLLCEDTDGELYIIELKKDSGYDDAYEQTAKYLDWFEDNVKFKGKKVNGIICLNNPTHELVKKIHNDERMRVFEYRISYTEL